MKRLDPNDKPPPSALIERWVGPDGYEMERIVDNRAAALEWDMRRRGVSPAIIERVLRLNGPEDIGSFKPLRGIHYKPGSWWGLPRGLVQKGEILRRHGREVWDAIAAEAHVKNGRRVWVSYRDYDRAVWRVSGPDQLRGPQSG
jgi:hypothetical protein